MSKAIDDFLLDMSEELTFIKAKKLALFAHGDQKYGKKPYSHHLEHVVSVAKRFGWREEGAVGTCCWLHDILEDTDATYEILRAYFGEYIADTVLSVTDLEGETKEDVFSKRTKNNKWGILVKMCDRIANMEACLAEDKNELLVRYVREYALFRQYLPMNMVDEKMSAYLEDLVWIANRRIKSAEQAPKE
jgi:guanosine-3',5'-bis(diphosphate) 3'-pyrophosphohydrolase